MVKKEVIPVEERNVRKLLDAWLEYNFSLLLKELSTNPLKLPEKPAPDYSKNSINLKSNPKWMTSDELRIARKTCSGLELKAVNDELRKIKVKGILIKLSGNPKFKKESEVYLSKLHETEFKAFENEINPNLKALDLQAGLDWIKNKILNFFQITLPMKDIINENVASSFLKGSKLASRQVNTQFSPNLQALKASQELTYNEINNMNSELREDIKRLFEREILAGSSSRKIEEELRKLKGFKSNNNIKAISRTELHRSYGTGWNSMLKDIGFDGDKQWSAVIDKRTSELCKANNKQTVPFDKPFKDLRTGEEVGMHNPFHINCFDDKTMVLTNNGFKFFNDLMFEDTILSLNPETLTTEYLKPVEYIKQEFRGLMYLYERGMVNFCVTPHHSNVVVKNRRVVLKETVNLSEIEEFLLSETKKTIIRKTDFKQVEYDGFVYDVELPKHHILFVKRFGEGMWSGNCRCTTVAIPRGVKLATQEEIRKELAKQTEQITASYRKT